MITKKYVHSRFAVCNSKEFENIWEDIKEKIHIGDLKEVWHKYVFTRDSSISYASFLNYVKWVKSKNEMAEKTDALAARGENVANSMAFEASKKVMERVKTMDMSELSAKDAINAVPKLAKVFQDSEKIKMDKNEQERNKALSEKILDKAIYEGEVVKKEAQTNGQPKDNGPKT